MEKIFIVHFVGDNSGLIIPPNASNDFNNINIIENLYPSHNYTKAYISIESFSGIINSAIDNIMVFTSGLNDTFLFTNGSQTKCENSNLIEVIDSNRTDIGLSLFSYKSNSDRWREISFKSLINFNLRMDKSNEVLFESLMYTIKFKLVE